MPNVTRPRRIRTLATAAFVLAACGSSVTSPSAGPQASSNASSPSEAPSPAPTRSFPTFPSFTPFPPIDERCVPVENIEPASPFVNAASSIGKFNLDMQVTRIEELTGRRHVAAPPVRELGNDGVGLLAGGHEFLTSPSTYFGGATGPIHMESAKVTLTLDGAPPVELSSRIVPGNENFDQFSIAVPDRSGSGTISMEFTWTDQCFRLDARGSIRVEVASTSEVGDCALEQQAAWDQLSALVASGMQFGDINARLGEAYADGTYTDMAVEGDGPYALALFDRAAPTLKVSPGAKIGMNALDPALSLYPLAARPVPFMKRSAVITWLADGGIYGGGPEPKVLWQSELSPRDDGSIRITAPKSAARYVAAIDLAFEYACGTGVVVSGIGVDVVAP